MICAGTLLCFSPTRLSRSRVVAPGCCGGKPALRRVQSSSVCWVIDRVVGERGPTNGSYCPPTQCSCGGLHLWFHYYHTSGDRGYWHLNQEPSLFGRHSLTPSLGLDTWHDVLNLWLAFLVTCHLLNKPWCGTPVLRLMNLNWRAFRGPSPAPGGTEPELKLNWRGPPRGPQQPKDQRRMDCQGCDGPQTPVLTVTFHALVDEAVEQRATVVAEGGAPVGVDLKLVLGPRVLQNTGHNRDQQSSFSVRGTLLLQHNFHKRRRWPEFERERS